MEYREIKEFDLVSVTTIQLYIDLLDGESGYLQKCYKMVCNSLYPTIDVVLTNITSTELVAARSYLTSTR